MANSDRAPIPSLREALEAYIRRRGIGDRLARQDVVVEWPALVGDRIAAVTTALRVGDDDVLVVAVRTAAWMQELRLLSPEIVRHLAQRGARIRAIRWVAG